MTLTIIHETLIDDDGILDRAEAAGVSVTCATGATTRLAQRLIDLGYDPAIRVRLMRADPMLSGAPFDIEGMSLGLAAILDPFSDHRDVHENFAPRSAYDGSWS
ncbi:MAG: hypothetical protein AAGA87_00535 [Pseudomonadota bacterium]